MSEKTGRPEGMNRRAFLTTTVTASALAAGAMTGIPGIFRMQEAHAADAAPFEFPNLPFAQDALEPVISERTLSFHYGKHHKGYFNKTNDFVKGTKYATMPLAQIVKTAATDPGAGAIFNNAAQFWNHTFYWNSLSPNGGGKPAGELAEKIESQFGGLGNLKAEFMDAATGQFGSGWAWLVLDKGELKTMNTPNADNPVAHGMTPLLTIDVWEHAYYLDYQNARGEYVDAVLDKLLNWKFAEANFQKATG
jgi:Fe-Mn family superoxide dismutase